MRVQRRRLMGLAFAAAASGAAHSFELHQHSARYRKMTLGASAGPPGSSYAPAPAETVTRPPFILQRIDHVVIRCQNFPAMFDFYHRVLGCTIDEPRDQHVNRFGGALTHLRAGSCYIDLLAYDTSHLSQEGVEAAERMHAGGAGLDVSKSLDDVELSSETSTLDHLCIRIDPFDEQEIITYLEREKADVVTAGDERLGADGIGPSVYVRDPEGNVIELKGRPHSQGGYIGSNSNGNQQLNKETGQTPRDEEERRGVDENSIESEQPPNDAKDDTDLPKAAVSGNSPGVPATPCNRICRYNSSLYDGKVCIGCFREAYEIEMWQSMTAVQKSMTLLDAIDRCSDNALAGESFDGAVSEDELMRQYEHWSDVAKIKCSK